MIVSHSVPGGEEEEGERKKEEGRKKKKKRLNGRMSGEKAT